MKLTDMVVKEYLEVLKSSAPAPGGGSASALTGAQGTALLLMVADLTLAREKYQEFHPLCTKTIQEGTAIYQQLLDAVDKDTQAFNAVSAAYKMPKETDEEKTARSMAIQEANLGATEVPFEVMQTAYKGLELVEGLVGHSNVTATSDLGVSALSLETALRGAWLNVRTNLSGLKDQGVVSMYERQGLQMYHACISKTAEIIESIGETL